MGNIISWQSGTNFRLTHVSICICSARYVPTSLPGFFFFFFFGTPADVLVAIIKGFYASWLQPKSLHERMNIFRNGPPLRLQPPGEVWSPLLRGFTCVWREKDRLTPSLFCFTLELWVLSENQQHRYKLPRPLFPGLLSVIVFSSCFSNDRDKPTAPPSLRQRRPIRRQTALFVSAITFDWELPTVRPTSCRPCDPTRPSPFNPLETFHPPVTAIHYRRAGNRGERQGHLCHHQFPPLRPPRRPPPRGHCCAPFSGGALG